MKNWVLVLSFFFVFTVSPMKIRAGSDSNVYIGVLENITERSPGWGPFYPCPRARVMFEKQGEDWISIDYKWDQPEIIKSSNQWLSSPINWSVVLNGKILGDVKSENDRGLSKSGGWIGLQKVPKNEKIPQIKIDANKYEYFEGPSVSRPLLLTTSAKIGNPEGWKTSVLTESEKVLAIQGFREKFPKLRKCKEPEEEHAPMVSYSDKQVEFLEVYRSDKNEILYGIKFKNNTCGFFDDDMFKSYWFVLDKNLKTRLLGNEMDPIGMADLDGTGKTEWVFYHFEGEDDESYILFYDDFEKSASFGWAYH